MKGRWWYGVNGDDSFQNDDGGGFSNTHMHRHGDCLRGGEGN